MKKENNPGFDDSLQAYFNQIREIPLLTYDE
jgi:hypothetical protein